jgi:deoxyribodipyrimidine photolyase-like uncharacterized protein
MKIEVTNRTSNMTTIQMLEEQSKRYAESYQPPQTLSFTFPRELINEVQEYIINNYSANITQFDGLGNAVTLDEDPILDRLLKHMFYAEEVKQMYRVTVDIMVEAEDEGDAEHKVTQELFNCDFAEVSVDSVYED